MKMTTNGSDSPPKSLPQVNVVSPSVNADAKRKETTDDGTGWEGTTTNSNVDVRKKPRNNSTGPEGVAKYAMKNSILGPDTVPVDLCGAHPELFVESLQGNIDIVWCDDSKKEGFIDPFMKAYFKYNAKDPNAVKLFQRLQKKTGIFVAVSRRESKDSNQAMMKEGSHGGLFKLTYFVRIRGSSSSDAETDRLTCLNAIADVSNRECWGTGRTATDVRQIYNVTNVSCF